MNKNNRFNIKWSPAHFPVGTTFTVLQKPGNIVHGDNRYTVRKVIRNAPNNHLLLCEEPSQHIEIPELTDDPIKAIFSIHQVKSIIKRGTGAAKVFHSDDEKNNIYKEDYLCTLKLILSDDSVIISPASAKTNYIFYGLRSTVMAYAEKEGFTNMNICIDIERVEEALDNQSFVLQHGMYSRKANKKRVDRWLKQNLNRYLTTIEFAAKRAAEALDDMYLQDLLDDPGELLSCIDKDTPHDRMMRVLKAISRT